MVDINKIVADINAVAGEVQKIAHLSAFAGNALNSLQAAKSNLNWHNEAETKQAQVDQTKKTNEAALATVVQAISTLEKHTSTLEAISQQIGAAVPMPASGNL